MPQSKPSTDIAKYPLGGNPFWLRLSLLKPFLLHICACSLVPMTEVKADKEYKNCFSHSFQQCNNIRACSLSFNCTPTHRCICVTTDTATELTCKSANKAWCRLSPFSLFDLGSLVVCHCLHPAGAPVLGFSCFCLLSKGRKARSTDLCYWTIWPWVLQILTQGLMFSPLSHCSSLIPQFSERCMDIVGVLTSDSAIAIETLMACLLSLRRCHGSARLSSYCQPHSSALDFQHY